MAFTNNGDRDLNSFLIGSAQTSAKIGPGYYQPSKDFTELKQRTKSKKPPAFLDGIAPGATTYNVGSNYLSTTFTPGPGKYNAEGAFSPFYEEIIKQQTDFDNFYTIQNGGKLTRRTQWFSADRTKKFATDDKASTQYVSQTVGPGDYNPLTALGDTF